MFKMFKRSRCCMVPVLVVIIWCFYILSVGDFFERIIHETEIKQFRSTSTGSRWTLRSRINLQKRPFVTSNNGQVFIVGAVGINSTTTAAWNKFNVYGQRYNAKKELLCCFKYPDGKISELPIERDNRFYTTGSVPLSLFNVICRNPRDTELPAAVSIVLTENSCDSSSTSFIKPYFPLMPADNSFAITTKISHANASPDLLITWMEAYLWLGVDKVITHALNNLSSDARMVLEYYARKNVLDLYEYQIPGLEVIPRSLQVQWKQTWTDAAVTMFDAFARNHGYTYFSVVDWDEFIIPSGNRTLKQLMKTLFAKNSSAAGFGFQTQFFITSTKPEASDVYLKKFVHRLKRPIGFNRKKIIFKPELARIGYTHDIRPIPGYQLLNCKPSDAFIRHFRGCLPKDNAARHCSKALELDLVKDMRLAKWSDNIDDNIRRAKAAIFPQTLK